MSSALCWYPVHGASAWCAGSSPGARCRCQCPVYIARPRCRLRVLVPPSVPVCSARCWALVPVPGAAVGDAERPPRPPPRPLRPGAAPTPAAAISANPRRGPAVPIGSRRSGTAPGAAAMVRPARTWDQPGPGCPARPRTVARARSRSPGPLPQPVALREGDGARGRSGPGPPVPQRSAGGTRAAGQHLPGGGGEATGPSPGHLGGQRSGALPACLPVLRSPMGVRAWAAGAALAWLRAQHWSPALGRSPGCGAGGTASLAGPWAGTVTRTEPALYSPARSGAAAGIPSPRERVLHLPFCLTPPRWWRVPRSRPAGPRLRGDLGQCPGWV